MGPQHDSCGRVEVDTVAVADDMLQWGRNMIVAEGFVLGICATLYLVLQWGRNMIVAEG